MIEADIDAEITAERHLFDLGLVALGGRGDAVDFAVLGEAGVEGVARREPAVDCDLRRRRRDADDDVDGGGLRRRRGERRRGDGGDGLGLPVGAVEERRRGQAGDDEEAAATSAPVALRRARRTSSSRPASGAA